MRSLIFLYNCVNTLLHKFFYNHAGIVTTEPEGIGQCCVNRSFLCFIEREVQIVIDFRIIAVVADIVYKHFQNKREGFLTNTRSKIVQRETLNRVAVELGLDKMVVYSAKLSSHNNHMYGNALEALIGAI